MNVSPLMTILALGATLLTLGCGESAPADVAQTSTPDTLAAFDAGASNGDTSAAADAGSAGDAPAATDAGTLDTTATDTGALPKDAEISDSGAETTTADTTPTADAGAADALDASATPDTVTADAGTPDTGTPDAGTPDAGTPDTGSSDAGGIKGYDGAPIAIEKLLDTQLTELCKARLACKSQQGNAPGLALSTVQGCMGAMAAEGFGHQLAGIIAAAAAGDIVYDATAAGACVASLTDSCEAAFAPPSAPSCFAMYKGTIADKAPCSLSAACKSGFCDLPETGCLGACAPKVAAGGSCNYTSQCAVGLTCFSGSCVPKVAGQAKDACDGGLPCGKGLWCAQAGAVGTCTALAAQGGPCINDQGCTAGLLCAIKTAGKPGTCEPPPAIGAACVYQTFTSSAKCGAGNACVPVTGGAVCKAAVAAGGKCSHTAECGALDMLCIGAKAGNGVCSTLPTVSQACTAADFQAGEVYSCLPPAACVGGKCVAPAAKGDKCVAGSSSPCAYGLTCLPSGLCGDVPKLGEACTFTCALGLSCKASGGANKCVALVCN